MRYKDIDKFIARFALQNGYTIETAKKRLLWKYLENGRILTEFLRIVGEGVEEMKLLDEILDEPKKVKP